MKIPDTTRKQPPRGQWGWYKVRDDANLPRVTTIAKALDDKESLIGYNARVVAYGLARRPDLIDVVAGMTSFDGDNRAKLDEVVNAALEAGGGSVKANLGTALHGLAERVEAHDLTVDEAPERYRPTLASYLRVLEAASIETAPGLTERCVYNLTYGYAGTADRYVWWVDPVDGRRKLVVADLKTGRVDLGWLDKAIQLAMYARAEYLWVDDPPVNAEPMPDELDPDVGLILHVPTGEGRADVYRVNLAEGFSAFLAAVEVRAIRKAWKSPTPDLVQVAAWATADDVQVGPKPEPEKPARKPRKSRAKAKAAEAETAGPLAREVTGAAGRLKELAAALDGKTPADAGALIDSMGPPDPMPTPDPDAVARVEAAAVWSPPDPVVVVDWLKGRVRAVVGLSDDKATAYLLDRWPETVPPLKGATELAPEQVDELDALLTRTEARFEVPFGATDPRKPPARKTRPEATAA